MWILVAIAAVFGLVFFILAYLFIRAQSQEEAQNDQPVQITSRPPEEFSTAAEAAVEFRPRNWKGWVGVFAFAGIFLGTGVLLLCLGGCQISRAVASESWPTTPGKIISAEVGVNYDSEGDTYSANVRYSYALNGREYVGEALTAADFSTSDYDQIAAQVAKYPPGRAVTVHYDPDNPQQAVLETGFTPGLWLLPLLGSVFFVVGSGMVTGLVWLALLKPGGKKKRRFYP